MVYEDELQYKHRIQEVTVEDLCAMHWEDERELEARLSVKSARMSVIDQAVIEVNAIRKKYQGAIGVSAVDATLYSTFVNMYLQKKEDGDFKDIVEAGLKNGIIQHNSYWAHTDDEGMAMARWTEPDFFDGFQITERGYTQLTACSGGDYYFRDYGRVEIPCTEHDWDAEDAHELALHTRFNWQGEHYELVIMQIEESQLYYARRTRRIFVREP